MLNKPTCYNLTLGHTPFILFNWSPFILSKKRRLKVPTDQQVYTHHRSCSIMHVDKSVKSVDDVERLYSRSSHPLFDSADSG